MPAQVEIVNLALDRIGLPPISNLDEGTRSASFMNRAFPVQRDAITRLHPWTFALAYAMLTLEEEDPEDRPWKFRFSKPDDWLRTVEVLFQGRAPRFEVTSEGVYSDVNPLQMRYIKSMEGKEEEFPSDVQNVIALKLAIHAVVPLSADKRFLSVLMAEYQGALTEARYTHVSDKDRLRIGAENWLQSQDRDLEDDPGARATEVRNLPFAP